MIMPTNFKTGLQEAIKYLQKIPFFPYPPCFIQLDKLKGKNGPFILPFLQIQHITGSIGSSILLQ